MRVRCNHWMSWFAVGLLTAVAAPGCGNGGSRAQTGKGGLGGQVDGQTGAGGIDGAPPPPPDFVWYLLNETSGTTAKDLSSHHYDITNLTGVTWNSGANFDGTNGGGSVQVDPSYRMAPITISAWLTPVARADESINQYALVPYPSDAIGDDIPSNWGYGLGLNVWTDAGGGAALTVEGVDTCQQPMFQCATHQTSGSPATFQSGQEVLVVAAIGPPATAGGTSAANVYVNGVLFHTSTSMPLSPGAVTLWLGVHNADTSYGTKRFFAGRMRDVRIYKRELSASEVAQLYSVGPTTVAPAP